MIGCAFDRPAGQGLRVLCLGAHSDDIEIGCGGTLLSLTSSRPDVEVRWVVFSAHGARADEAQRSAELFVQGASRADIELLQFRDGFLPWQGAEVKERFEEQKAFDPHVILTHHGRDRHQDHRILSDLAWNTFRHHLILEYEIPKYDGDLGTPGVFIPLDQWARDRKVELLMEIFGTQRARDWFTPETFNGLMRLRGIECASPTGYAEAYYARKLVLRGGVGPT